MNPLAHKHLFAALAILAVPVVMGADGNGCQGGDVNVGTDDPCVETGCSGQICAEEDVASDCSWTPIYACYQELGVCERSDEGECGWRPTQELQDCIDNGGPDPDPGGCVVTGCSGEICADEDMASDCQYQPEYACFAEHGICERSAGGTCGWRDTDELEACLADPRSPAEGACVRNNGDECESDADCTSGGCGGELCFNPAVSEGASTCDCSAPAFSCGCVQGQCVWYE